MVSMIKGYLVKFSLWLFVILTVLALPVTVNAYLVGASQTTILPGVQIHGWQLGGLTEQTAAAYLSGYFSDFAARPVEVIAGTQSWSVIPRDSGVLVDTAAVLRRAVEAGNTGSFVTRWRMRHKIRNYGLEIPLILTVNYAKLAESLQPIVAAIETDPVDAQFVISEDRVSIVPSQSGVVVDYQQLEADFLAACRSLSHRVVEVALIDVPPALTTAQAESMGITAKVASYVTEFDPDDVDRSHNILLAAQALQNVLVAPGETFSFNKTTGPRSARYGYRPAPVIIDGELLPGIGGGVCQVSTTLYNVVLLADLAVTNRVAHSLPVTYVPLGQDATVAYDHIDFQFTNTRSHHLLIDTNVTDNQLEIAFYGTPTDNHRVQLQSRLVGLIEPETRTVEDPTLPPGAWKEVDAGRPGYRVEVYRVVMDETGQRVLASTKVEETVYPPRHRVLRVAP